MSYLEDAFAFWMRQYRDIPEPVREYRFHPTRKWRFDFAFIDEKVAVEIEGVVKQGGRHQTIQGFLKDAEKYEAAHQHGWTVYRVPGPWVANPDRYVFRDQVIATLRILLGIDPPLAG